jgi:hypothetical protein
MSRAVAIPNSFFEEVWDRRSGVLPRSQLSVEFPDDTVIFDAVKLIGRRAADQAQGRARKDSVANMISALDNRPSDPQPEPHLVPDESDRDLDGYLDRCESFASGRSWATAFFGLHKVSSELWDFAKDFVDDIVAAAGRRPAGRVDFDCFVGRYEKTHVGAHIDDAHSFGFNLRPGKQLLTWPQAFDATMRTPTSAYEQYRAESTVLDCDPDVVTYFPAREIHVAESLAGVSVNSNIALFEEVNHVDRLWLQTRREIEAIQVRCPAADGLNPADVYTWLDGLSRVAVAESLEVKLLSAALCWTTSGQLGCARPKAVQAPGVASSPRKRRELVARTTRSGAAVLVSGNGRALVVAAEPAVSAFLEAYGEIAIDAPLPETLTASVDRSPAVASLFRTLWTWGVLVP